MSRRPLARRAAVAAADPNEHLLGAGDRQRGQSVTRELDHARQPDLL